MPELHGEEPHSGWKWNETAWRRPAWHKRLVAAFSDVQFQLTKLALLPIFDRPDIADFEWRGEVLLLIDKFDVKKVPRNIKFKAPGKQDKDIPQPPKMGSMRTRWDLKLRDEFEPQGKQRITLKLQLDDKDLRFMWAGGDFPLTAKTPRGQLLLSNPLYDPGDGRWISVELLYDPGDPEMCGEADYNIALIVSEPGSSEFVLPIIVDPVIGNRG